MLSPLPLFHGSLTAIITPMTENGNIDFPSLKHLVEYHIQSGTHGLVVMGTTGEAATLEKDEYLKVISTVVEVAQKRIPIIAGTGSNSTKEAIKNTNLLENIGIDACLTVVPYYNKPTQEGMYQHFKAIAESTELPQILYNVPGRTGADMQPETIARLSLIDNIIGVKEATGDLSRIGKIKSLTADDFIFLSGDDETGFESMKLGGQGVISVSNNIVAKEMAKMCELALLKEFEQAEKINNQLMVIHKALFVESNPIPVKWAAYKLGLIKTPNLRLPLTTLTEQNQKVVNEALIRANIL